MMLKVLVVSDTHCSTLNQLPKKVIDEISKVDAIIHAGDYTSIDLVNELKSSKNFFGVYGNMDDLKIKTSLSDQLLLELNGFKIGVTHPPEGGPPFGIKKKVIAQFDEKLDGIIYGHTHKPEIIESEGVLFMNPGSTSKPFPMCPKAMIILTISNKLEPKLVNL